MLRSKLLTANNANIFARFCSCSPGTAHGQEKWDLLAAVCVERKPQIPQQMTEMQTQFQELLKHVEFEKSYKSVHEVRHERDLKQLELLKKGDVEGDIGLKQTAQDFVDMSLDELNKFQLSSVTTEADKKNDVKSCNRKLTKNLVLLTQQKIGEKTFYLLPQGTRNDGETLRQTAERVLNEQVGSDCKTQIYGNAPMGFYKYKYPKKTQKSSVGAKVFIYFARHKSGELDAKSQHKWLDRTELSAELPEKYLKSVELFLIDE